MRRIPAGDAARISSGDAAPEHEAQAGGGEASPPGREAQAWAGGASPPGREAQAWDDEALPPGHEAQAWGDGASPPEHGAQNEPMAQAPTAAPCGHRGGDGDHSS